MDSREMRAKRKALIDEQRRIMQPALDEVRGFTSEEQEKLDKTDAALTALEQTIARAERVESEERAFVPETQRETAVATPQAEDRAAKYRDAFWNYFRGLSGSHELRVLTVATDTQGGHTVPDEFRRQLVTALDEANVMRSIGSTVITSNSGTLTMPVLSTRASASWVAESGAYSETTPTFSEVTFSAYKAAGLIKVSEELLNDSAFPLQAWVAGEFARALAELEETAFVVGTGSTQPTGVVGGSGMGKTATATNAVTADEIMDLFHSLGRPYRRNAKFLMHDSTVKAIRKLVTGVSGDKTYLWQPGLQAGEPDMLLGRPVYTTPDMDEIASAKKVILFGDFSYYYIVDRQAISVQRLDELYSGNGQVGFRIFKRTDGKLVLADAMKHLLMA